MWAIIEVDNTFFPQDGPIALTSNGEWHTIVYVGDERDTGKSKEFVIYIGMAGPEGSAQFASDVTNGQVNRSNTHPSQREPFLHTLKLLNSSVTVTRQ